MFVKQKQEYRYDETDDLLNNQVDDYVSDNDNIDRENNNNF